jgi:hypothetical protein
MAMRREKAGAIILDVLFFIVPFAFSMPVIAKVSLWALAWFLTLGLISVHQKLSLVEWDVKFAWSFVLTMVMFVIFKAPIYHMWRSERSAATEGELKLDKPFPTFFRVMEVGDSGAWFTWLPGTYLEQMRPAYDSGFRIEGSSTGLQVSTQVRDGNGNLLLEVTNNRWKIYPAFCSDKNYTNDSLEVLDNRGHVIFQLKLLPDEIRIQGEWYDGIGQGVQVIKSSDPKTPGALFIPEDHKRGLVSTQLIQPLFVYPSKEHWGEIAR